MSSVVPPFVSGMKNAAQTNWQTIISAKKPNVAEPARSAAQGKAQLISVQRNQWMKHPNACPFARTAFGKTSEM